MRSIAVFSPAKINLFLAVTGRRPDGFHELVSLVAQLALGDTLWLQERSEDGEVTLICDDPTVPSGADNLAVRAAVVFRGATGVQTGLEISLHKRLPMGAGLGGGSSNATAVLRALNVLCGRPLPDERLVELAAQLGSDCPLFLSGGASLMRGRGERIEPVGAGAAEGLTGRRVLIFKPDFSISTPWAYGQLAADPRHNYSSPDWAEERLRQWQAGDFGLQALLFNSFEVVAFRKFVALPTLADCLRAEPGVEGVLMSGSGSACFALLGPGADGQRLSAVIREALGSTAWIAETTFA